MPSQENGRPLDPTSRRTFIGERVHIDEVVGDVGPVSLGDLSDVDDAISPAKGSILVGDGSIFRELSVGVDGQVLTVDLAQIVGLKWAPAGAGSGAKGLFVFGAGSIGSTTTPRYLYPGYDDDLAETISNNDSVVPSDGFIKNLCVRHNILGVGLAIVTYTLVVNGVDSALAVGLAASSAYGANFTTSVAVIAGDRIRIRVDKAAVVGSPENVQVTMELST